jgi:archaellum biogenesis protein FlaJ (TadC family)
MTKLYAFVFWNIRGFFKGMYDDGYAGLKAQALMGSTEVLGIVAIANILSILVGRDVLPESTPSLVLLGAGTCIGIATLNYRLLSENKWARFDSEFKNYSAGKKIFGRLAIIAVIIGIMAIFLASGAAFRHLLGVPTSASAPNSLSLKELN